MNVQEAEKPNAVIEKQVGHSIRPGYKQTEVGLIPEDWDVKLLPQLCQFRGGKAHEQFVSEIGEYICVNSKFISSEGAVVKYVTANFCTARKDDILMVMSDLPNGQALAKAFLVDANDRYAINQRVCALTSYGTCPRYLFYTLNRNPYFLAFDDGVTQTHLLNGVFQKCPLPVPRTLAEQEAIAEALGDADALVESLEQLLAKKRHLKQAAMQQLLTGKKRLPGFEGSWETKRLGDLGATYGGLTGKTKAHFGHGNAMYIPFMNVMSNVIIDTEYLDLVLVEDSEGQNAVQRGDLFFNGSSETPEEVGMCSILETDVDRVYLNSFCFGYRLREGTDAIGLFLVYYLRSQRGRDLLRSLAQGATRYNLSKTALMNVEIPLPGPQEQAAIVEVLVDMDMEIAAIEAKIAKARHIKVGMMQELLTGRMRLV